MVYYKTLYGNLLYPWIFFRNNTCKTILFHLLVQCLLLLLHVESWAISNIIERVIGGGRWGEVEEIESRKLSWFTGKTHHTLSAIKSSHAFRSVQELTSNRPNASSDRQTDQKTIHSPNTGEKATTFQSFSSAIFPSWPAMTSTVMLSDFRVTSLSETDRNDTAINNKCKLTFWGTAEYALTLQQIERNNSEKQKPMPKYVGNNWSALQFQMRKTQSSIVD